jgi:hypothetical protein
LKDRVIRFALVFVFLASTVRTANASATTASDGCPTGIVAQALSPDELPPPEMLTVSELHLRAVEIEQELAKLCGKKRECSTEDKKQAAWKVVAATVYRWTLRPVLTRVAPVGLLVGAITSVIVALNMIDQNFSKESVATVSAVFGLLTSQIVNGMMAPALTPITSKFTQFCWRVARWAKGERQLDYASNPQELDELYAKMQDLVRLTAQAARSTWFEHASLAEDSVREAAYKWTANTPNREVVVPNLIAMTLRRMTKRFPEINLLGDLEIEREFRFMFRNQFTLTALTQEERQSFAALVIAALEAAEREIEEEDLPAQVRAYYVRLLDALILRPEHYVPRNASPTPPTEESKTAERA